MGSPYCVHRYVVDKHFGGPEGLGAGFEMSDPGLYVELDAWGFHFLRIEEEDHV